ncbi:iqgap- protein [Malassezia vespertilionis]|uniref:iqgap- protein n=1 Tax=Malassezia vespertilionis TaxID=2020962 RepID=UPI0024B050A8|nr:iqgap- protein [Malassezia vespertilionis]WFD07450.1 iqgap- protein [Malassezia vespertilionis]
MMNLTLYTTRAVLILDADGSRVYAKYFQPPQETLQENGAANAAFAQTLPPGLAPLIAKNPYQTLKEQHALEHAVWEKARRASGDLFQYDNNLVLFKASYDIYVVVIAPERENELMMHSFLGSLHDALNVLLQGQIDKRTVLDNLDLVTLAIDECVDDGIILETDSAAITNRVTRPRADATEVQITEQTLMNAYTNFRDRYAIARLTPSFAQRLERASPASPSPTGIAANPFVRASLARDEEKVEEKAPTPRAFGKESSFAAAKRMFSADAENEPRGKSAAPKNAPPQSTAANETSLPTMRLARQSLATAPKDTGQAYEYLCHCSEAQQWIESCIGEHLGGDIADMGEEMRNGIALAKLAKHFEPECVPRIFVHPRLQFRHTDNINYFFRFVDKIRLPNCFRFELTDLYEKKNFPKVVYTIHALSWFMAHQGRADKVDDLLGKLHFDPTQLSKTQKSIDTAGGTMPSFSGVGQALAQEMGTRTAARKVDADWIKPRHTTPASPAPRPVDTRAQDALARTMDDERKAALHRSIQDEARARALQLTQERERKRIEQDKERERERQARQSEREKEREERQARLDALGRERELQREARDKERDSERQRKRADDESERERQRKRREEEYRRERERTQREHETLRAKEALLAEERDARAKEREAGEARLERERERDALLAQERRDKERFQRELEFELERKRQLEEHAQELAKARAETAAAEERLRMLAEDAARREKQEKDKALAALAARLGAAVRGAQARRAFSTIRAALHERSSAYTPIQAQVRGVRMRQQLASERKRVAALVCGRMVVQLQAAVRGELYRRAFYQRFETLDAAEHSIEQFQAHARGALARRRIFALLLQLERHMGVFVGVQASVRVLLVQQRLLGSVQSLRSDMVCVVHMQAQARGAIARRAYAQMRAAFCHAATVRSVERMQTSLRAALSRRRHQALRKEITRVQPDFTHVQAAVRGMLVRQEHRWWTAHLHASEPVAVYLQSLVRGVLVRRAFARKWGHYIAHRHDIIHVQALVRARKQARDYARLRAVHPPLAAVRAYAHLLDNSDEVQEALAAERLRADIVQRIRENKAMESVVEGLETKNAILIRNKMGIEEKAMQRTERGLLGVGEVRHKHSVLADANDPFTELARDRSSTRRRALYEALFYLVQTRPQYLAKLLVLTNEAQAISDEDRAQFEQTVLAIFNYASQPREEYLLLKLLQRTIVEELASVPELGAFVHGYAPFHRLLVHFSRGVRECAYLAQLFGPLVRRIAEERDVDMEIDPSVLHRQRVEHEERATGMRVPQPLLVDFDEALNDPHTRTAFIRHLQALREIADLFLHALCGAEPQMPYGMRYIARELHHALMARFPDAPHTDIVRGVAAIVYQRYMHPAIVAPESISASIPLVEALPRKNLAAVSLLLLQIARGVPFGDDQPCLQPLNEYVLQNAPRVQHWIQHLIDTCPDPELVFGTDEYTDAASTHAPVIYVSPNQVYAVHQLLCNNLANLVTRADDPLQAMLSELGAPPVSHSKELDTARNAEIMLELSRRLTGVEDVHAEAGALFVETKRLVLAVLTIQTADDLLQLFLAPVTEADEHAWEAQLARGNLRDLQHLSFAELKAATLENMLRLEQMGKVRRVWQFQEMLDALARDIRSQHRRRAHRHGELAMLQGTLSKLAAHNAFLHVQITEYREYADQTIKTMQRRSHPFTLPFTKQYFHVRHLKAQGALPRFGSYKFSAARLREKQVLVHVDGPEYMLTDHVTLTISCDEPGVFMIGAAVSGIEAGTHTLRMEELLEAQYNGQQSLQVLDRAVTLDVPHLVQLINKKFYT